MSQKQFTLFGGMILGLFLTACTSLQSSTNFEVNKYLPITQIANTLENERNNSNSSITDEEEEIYLPLVTNSSATTTTGTGYNLFSSLGDTATYLIDEDGETVFTWSSAYRPGNAVYLLENGNLLRTGNTNAANFNTGGVGGIVEEIDANSNVIWSYKHDTTQGRLHHDIEQLPNGNILMLAWELKTGSESLAAGRNPNLLNDGELWPDTVIEVDPNTNSIVWEWHVWDHLVQDYDSSKANYGVVADHPELIDINYRGTGAKPGNADWNHMNAVDYNAEFDQILLSVRNFSEIWIIDHSATMAEAASHSGGSSNMGGDLLYRWGNPQAYDSGSASDQQLFVQHDAQWIPDGYSGAGNILLFNNGVGRSDGDYSSIDEIAPPVDSDGNYSGYGLTAPEWTYTAVSPTDFYAANISSAQRLPNGNTLICDGPSGYFFEVTDAGEMVWEYDHGNQAIFRVIRYESDYAGLPSFN
ncbi:MAG: arylsulfotransferase (ASST) [Chloroflexi bacterium]|nr:arylsulfotransferase (ASST) [Chloroflexota bacterium]